MSIRFIDLFAGIGGLRLPFSRLGCECVFSSEIDKFARLTYAVNYDEIPHGDITKIDKGVVPEHDLLLAGFPCQAFSKAGLRKGLDDARGTLFFEIYKTLIAKRPSTILLENVKNLLRHDNGRTFELIVYMLTSEPLNYQIDFRVFNACDFGVPQNRERVYIVGISREASAGYELNRLFNWPVPPLLPTCVGDILEPDSEATAMHTVSDKGYAGFLQRRAKHKAAGNGFGFTVVSKESVKTNALLARYHKDGSDIIYDQAHLSTNPRKLTPRECARLQGLPDSFILHAVSNTQAYKQLGNSVAIPVVSAIASELVTTLNLLGV